jgi:hypothetical protein
VGVREDTLQALRDGFTPGQFSRQRGVSLTTTLKYLNEMVGEGRLRRSDILFSIPSSVRKAIEDAPDDSVPEGVDPADYDVVKLYGNAGHALGDMYDDLREIEVALHWFIEEHLKSCLGDSEAGWWRKGIPEAIRKTCQTRREEDDEPADHAYGYTDLLDLGRIIEYCWQTFQPSMPEPYRSNRRQLLDDLRRLNGIRRMVMHPVRGTTPTEDDFEFVRSFRARVYPTILVELKSLQKHRERDTDGAVG